jgi:hypothetical protein
LKKTVIFISMINFRPGEGVKNVYGVGGARFIKDTYVAPYNPPQPAPVEEVEEETKPTENELQRTQVEQTEVSSGSGTKIHESLAQE